jgi:hypothetical protein
MPRTVVDKTLVASLEAHPDRRRDCSQGMASPVPVRLSVTLLV